MCIYIDAEFLKWFHMLGWWLKSSKHVACWVFFFSKLLLGSAGVFICIKRREKCTVSVKDGKDTKISCFNCILEMRKLFWLVSGSRRTEFHPHRWCLFAGASPNQGCYTLFPLIHISGFFVTCVTSAHEMNFSFVLDPFLCWMKHLSSGKMHKWAFTLDTV